MPAIIALIAHYKIWHSGMAPVSFMPILDHLNNIHYQSPYTFKIINSQRSQLMAQSTQWTRCSHVSTFVVIFKVGINQTYL
jgi:hypothetical protein